MTELELPPVLAAEIRLARAQRAGSSGVTAARIHAGYRTRRRRQIATVGAGAVATLAVVLGLSNARAPELRAPLEHRIAATESRVGESQVAIPAEATPRARLALDAAIELVALGEGPAPEVLGPRHVRLVSGSYRLELAAGAGAPVRVDLPERTFELRHGVVVIENVVAGTVRLESGEAVWVDTLGRTEPMQVASPVPATTAPDRTAARTASALLAEAERRLVAGDDQGALAVLKTLVERHPSSTAARAGLLDLGRLLRSMGRRDEARCAFALHQHRWPDSPLRGDVDQALRQLGNGPRCEGLKPAR